MLCWVWLQHAPLPGQGCRQGRPRLLPARGPLEGERALASPRSLPGPGGGWPSWAQHPHGSDQVSTLAVPAAALDLTL